MTSHIQPEASWNDEKTYAECFFEECAFTKKLSPKQCQYAIDYFSKFVSHIKEKAVQEDRRRIINMIEEEKSKGYEANTILEGLIAELKVGHLINQKNV